MGPCLRRDDEVAGIDHDQTFGLAHVFAETHRSRSRVATVENG